MGVDGIAAASPALPSEGGSAATFDDYQRFSMSRAGITFAQGERLTLAGLGLAGEAGELSDLAVALLAMSGKAGKVADYIKKTVYHGKPIDADTLILEAGDVLWYLAYLADALGVPLSRIAAANRDKLLARYPSGFSVADAAARKDEAPTNDAAEGARR